MHDVFAIKTVDQVTWIYQKLIFIEMNVFVNVILIGLSKVTCRMATNCFSFCDGLWYERIYVWLEIKKQLWKCDGTLYQWLERSTAEQGRKGVMR